jgi:hypothetical protein
MQKKSHPQYGMGFLIVMTISVNLFQRDSATQVVGFLQPCCEVLVKIIQRPQYHGM